ncbi:Nif3-like dinuclear metal center hexameric protein [Chloroflexota bacterium]
MKRNDLVAYLEDFLQTKTIDDVSDNGLQVEGAGEVTHVAFAVDSSQAAFEAAQAAGAQMLIVHHGLFWGRTIMITGVHRHRLGTLFDANLSLYASHLPLDLHERVGNNATLALWLELDGVIPFGHCKGLSIGVEGCLHQPLSLDAFVQHLEKALGEPVVRVWTFGPETVRRVGVVSGGAGFLVDEAAKAGLDVYLTGELSHNAYHQAREWGLNVVFGGHYATETAGLKALAGHLKTRFDLETTFIDLPTGT